LAAAWSSCASAAAHSFQVKCPLLGEFDGQRERLRLPRLGKYRAAVVAK
jgi:hypothetical protein